MKATLEFTLPEEKEEYENACRGADYKLVIEDLLNWVRQLSKYEDKDTVMLDELRDKIYELREREF